MKNLFYFLIGAVVLSSCNGGSQGYVTGVQPREDFYQVDPYGMNYIHMGSFTMGPNDEDVPFAYNSRSRVVSIAPFYIDDTEISNNEYRQFVHYVKDSIIRRILGEGDFEDDFLILEDEFGEEYDDPKLNWRSKIRWNNPEVYENLENAGYFLPPNERFYGQRVFDPRKLMFEYFWYDLPAAARKGSANRDYKDGRDLDLSTPEYASPFSSNGGEVGVNNKIRSHRDRSRFIKREVINVYPDTLVWVHDFTYSFNEPMTEAYFWHPAYDDYPVVGVTWQQAVAFNAWRTRYLNTWLAYKGRTFVQRFRLPSEAEWEFAARGGLNHSVFPWGSYYIRNREGCFLANGKFGRGNYTDDGGFYTVPVTSYEPNDYGLFCMAGNVAEWTNTAFDESVYDFASDLNPEYVYHAKEDDPETLKRKVIRGGSWKDISYYLQVGTRSFEYQDTAKSYVGFRSTMSYLGRGKPGTTF
ncbi:MAG: T9SS ring complex lipoprotein PorK/GldK [Luteibaculaceae bacterium]